MQNCWEREKEETQESKDYLNNSECSFKNCISVIYWNSQFLYLNVWPVIQFQADMMFEGHFVMVLPWFRLFAIQGEKVHSVQKQIENISEHKSKEWLPHSTLCTHYGVPKALVLFVLALFL